MKTSCFERCGPRDHEIRKERKTKPFRLVVSKLKSHALVNALLQEHLIVETLDMRLVETHDMHLLEANSSALLRRKPGGIGGLQPRGAAAFSRPPPFVVSFALSLNNACPSSKHCTCLGSQQNNKVCGGGGKCQGGEAGDEGEGRRDGERSAVR